MQAQSGKMDSVLRLLIYSFFLFRLHLILSFQFLLFFHSVLFWPERSQGRRWLQRLRAPIESVPILSFLASFYTFYFQFQCTFLVLAVLVPPDTLPITKAYSLFSNLLSLRLKLFSASVILCVLYLCINFILDFPFHLFLLSGLCFPDFNNFFLFFLFSCFVCVPFSFYVL